MTIQVPKRGIILRTLTGRDSRKVGVDTYSTNPFWKDTVIKVGKKRINVAGGYHTSADGSQTEHSGIHVVHPVDKSEFIKIYTKNVKAIFDLKPSAQRVLQYVMVELQKTPGADAIYLAWIGVEEYLSAEQVSMGRSSFHRALKELLKNKFLAESTKPSMYWFNTNLFFNGDRMTFINEYRIKPDNSNSILEHPDQSSISDYPDKP